MPCQVHRTVDGRENVENGRKSTSKLRTVVTLGDAHTMGGAYDWGARAQPETRLQPNSGQNLE